MNCRITRWLFLLSSCVVAGFSQERSPSAAEQTDAQPAPPGEEQGLFPSWMTWGVELRGRLELPTAIDFEDDHNDQFCLVRIRAWTALEASQWLRFYVQIQDARAPGFSDPDSQDAVIHHVDFREAYADFGSEKGWWGLRAGRQELAFGDERLVGADNYWDPLGQVFDALRLSFKRPGVRLDAFGAFVVTPTSGSLIVPSTGNRLYGLYASFDKLFPASVVEPYFFWKTDRGVGDGLGPDGGDGVLTYGARAAGKLPASLHYNVEMALQRGHKSDEAVHAWAGHWEIGFRPLAGDLGPRFAAEYNFATGDSHGQDGRHTTFDDLYPAGFNKYGMADPFAWRNNRNLSGGVDWSFSQKWKMGAGYRAIWLASDQDGLYTKGDAFLTLNPAAAGTHVGNQASIMTGFEPSKSWQIYGGYARFFPGQYLIDSLRRGAFSSPYFMLNYKFE